MENKIKENFAEEKLFKTGLCIYIFYFTFNKLT